MEQYDLEVLSRFESVWQRVQGAERCEREESSADAQGLLEGLTEQICGYRSMARQVCGRRGRQLETMAKALEGYAAFVQFLQFLHFGDTVSVKVKLHFASYTPSNLRKLWQSNVRNIELAENLHLLQGQQACNMLTEMREEMQRHSRILEDQIRCLLQ